MLLLVIPTLALAGATTWLALTHLTVTGPIWTTITVVMAISLAACVRVRITVDSEHLWVRSWLLGLRLMRIRLSEVTRVHVEASRATRWGNWGLRSMLWGKMLAVRGDQALVMQMDSGRDVLIVVRHAEYLAVEVGRRAFQGQRARSVDA